MLVYDYVIVGGGVAGIFSAEILSRTGKAVLLIEKEGQLATESSGEQHGWGQFGSLYFNLSDPGVAQDCLNNVEIMLNNYPFPGNNLRAVDGELISENANDEENWYRAEPVYHYMPEPDYISLKLSDEEQFKWEEKLQNVLVRTKAVSEHRWNEQSLDSLLTNSDTVANGAALRAAKKMARKWMQKCELHHPNGFIANKRMSDRVINVNIDNCVIISSHDRPMRSICIVTSVYNRYLHNGGKTLLNTEIIDYSIQENGLVVLHTSTGTKLLARKVVYTAGSGLGAVSELNIKTDLSPLLIVEPAICHRNFVYLTPRLKYTVNHLYHYDHNSKKDYSIIGNGDRVKLNAQEAIEESRINLLRQAESIFPNLSQTPPENKKIYFGLKTEFVKDNLDRNYRFAFFPIHSDKIFGAVPGKFTFAPSLAHHIYETLEKQSAQQPSFLQNENALYKQSLQSISHRSPISPELHGQIVSNNVLDIDKRVKRNRMTFYRSHYPYPSLLTQFGCYQRKVSLTQLANALWLIESRFGDKTALQVRTQFFLWAEDKKIGFDEHEITQAIKQTYQI